MQSSSETQLIGMKIKNAVEVNADTLGSIAAKISYCENIIKYFNDKKRQLAQSANNSFIKLAALQCADINKDDFHGSSAIVTHLEESLKKITAAQGLDSVIDTIQQFQEALYDINKEVSVLALKNLIKTTDPLKLKGIASKIDPQIIQNSDSLANYTQDQLDDIFNIFIVTSRTLDNIAVATESPLKRRSTVTKRPAAEQPKETSFIGSVYGYFAGSTGTPPTPPKHERVATVGKDVLEQFKNMQQGSPTEPVKSEQQKHASEAVVTKPNQTTQLEQPKVTKVNSVQKVEQPNVRPTPVAKPQPTTSDQSTSSVKELQGRLGSLKIGTQAPASSTLSANNRYTLSQPPKETKDVTKISTGVKMDVDQNELQQRLNARRTLGQ